MKTAVSLAALFASWIGICPGVWAQTGTPSTAVPAATALPNTAKPGAGTVAPLVDPATLPEPELGVGFHGKRVMDEIKLVEHGDDSQAVQMAKAALQEATNSPRAARDELRLELALVYLRVGSLTEANGQLSQLSKTEVEDSAARDTGSVARRALVLQTMGQCVRRTKDNLRPIAGAEGWKLAQSLAAKELAAKAKTADGELQRHATNERWADAAASLRTARIYLEALVS